MTISLEWTKTCQNEKEKQQRLDLVLHGVRLREVIKEILEHKLQEAERASLRTSNYTAGWPFRQADHTGYKRALTEVALLMETNQDGT